MFVQDVSSPLPSLVAEGETWIVYFDNARLLDKATNLFSKALQAWYAVYWVFSVQYPAALRLTCTFIEKYCIGHKCTAPGAVKRLAKKIIK
jgi:hypothetical protein